MSDNRSATTTNTVNVVPAVIRTKPGVGRRVCLRITSMAAAMEAAHHGGVPLRGDLMVGFGAGGMLINKLPVARMTC